MNHVIREYVTKMIGGGFLDPVSEFICFYVINITSLCCPVFPVCHISAKQLLIKRYKPPRNFASQTTPVQNTLFVCTINMIN